MRARELWRLVESQHGVVTRGQLLEHGMHPRAIHDRAESGRLHRLWRGLYAVGRPVVSAESRWMAAVFVPAPTTRRRPGIRATRRVLRSGHVTRHRGIPVTTPARTLLDMAPRRSRTALERAIDEADRLDLIDPERLRQELGGFAGLRGAPALRAALDRHTFVLTRSVLERRFLPIARRAGLPRPRTQARVNGFVVDFYWPDLSLVVETDGLRYHRTAAQQARDLRRDQAHWAAGLLPVRFAHSQVAFESSSVERVLRDAIRRGARPGA